MFNKKEEDSIPPISNDLIKKLNEKSSAFTDMILNQKTVVRGVISDVKDVSDTERGIFPFLKWVKIPDINPPGARRTTAIEIAKILELKTR